MDRPFKLTAPPPDPPKRPPPRLRLSLQAKLILTLLSVVTIALGSCCWLFAGQSTEQLTEMMSQQARVVAYTVSVAAELPLKSGNHKELDQIGQDLLKTRNVLYVAFFDARQKPISLANRYASFSWDNVSPIGATTDELNLGEPHHSTSFGEHIDVQARVLDKNPPKLAHSKNVDPDRKVTAGYVVVGISLDRETAQMQWVNWIVVGIGLSVVLLSLPVAYAMVWGIFTPIRELVEATRKIAAGRLDVQVNIDRNDLIGELAGSFSEMVTHVRKQREDLASTNSKLADANEQLGQANRLLAEANRGLEDKVLQRTAQLETANKRLSDEIAEKEDFIRAISHDLNAPLRNIDGMATMLLTKNRDSFSPDVVHRLERIQKNVEVESDLISELLELSRIKSRRQKMEPVDVEALVQDLGGMFEQDLSSKGIQLILETPLPHLLAEKARVRQIFQNLIDNAIKYMGLQTVREIRIGCIVRTEEAEFYVQDSGMGIDAEDVGKIFYIFRRGRGAAAQNVPGKGVGLASVKSIIETYSGTIWVTSEAGNGSTFRFTINGQYVGSLPQPTPDASGPASRLAA